MKGWIILIFGLILVNGCASSNTEEDAQKTAEKFAREWEQKDFESMYDLFIPNLQQMRNKEDFVKFFLASETSSNVVIRLDKVSKDSENVAYAYYTFSSPLSEYRAPAMKLEYVNGNWKVNAFPNFFTGECTQECPELKCKEFICSKETGFECKYENMKCSCERDLDCPSDRPLCVQNNCIAIECKEDSECGLEQKFIRSCELKGPTSGAKARCSYGECVSSCYEHLIYFENPTQQKNSMLNINVNVFAKIIEIKNFDQDLTDVVLIIDSKYKKEIGELNKNEIMIIEKTELLDDSGKDLSGGMPVNLVYLYSQQGRWWN